MATGKRSFTATRALSSKRQRMVSPPAAAIQASLGGMGFESLLPLLIISKTFCFLKCVNLSSVGLGLNEILFKFGWDLVVWKPILEQSEPKGALEPSEVQTLSLIHI